MCITNEEDDNKMSDRKTGVLKKKCFPANPEFFFFYSYKFKNAIKPRRAIKTIPDRHFCYQNGKGKKIVTWNCRDFFGTYT